MIVDCMYCRKLNILIFYRYQSMLPVLKMASVHNVELVKFFFKLLYQADTQKPEVKGIHTFYNSFILICNISEIEIYNTNFERNHT